jgi:hypothetical protein
MTKLGNQRGLSLTGLLFVCAVIGLVALLIMRLFPLYSESWKVYGAMKSVAAQPDIGSKSPKDIYLLLARNFAVTDVDRFDEHNLKDYVKIEKIKNSRDRNLRFAYEGRGPFVHDLDLVLKFNKSIILPGKSAAE